MEPRTTLTIHTIEIIFIHSNKFLDNKLAPKKLSSICFNSFNWITLINQIKKLSVFVLLANQITGSKLFPGFNNPEKWMKRVIRKLQRKTSNIYKRSNLAQIEINFDYFRCIRKYDCLKYCWDFQHCQLHFVHDQLRC